MTLRILTALFLCVASLPVAAGTREMCLDVTGTTEVLCDCASEKLAAEAVEEDTLLYDAIGTLYLENKAGGQSMADAWEAALGAVASEHGHSKSNLRTRMNAVGKAHRTAMIDCG